MAAKQLFLRIPLLFLASFKQDKTTSSWTPTPASLASMAGAEKLVQLVEAATIPMSQ